MAIPNRIALALLASLAVTACNGGGSALPSGAALPGAAPLRSFSDSPKSPIEHVVIVIQENRSFDNFFATFPGADGATQGEEKVKEDGKWVDEPVTLKQMPLVGTYDFTHCHATFETAYDGGKMDGFDYEILGACGSGGGKPAGTLPYQYVEESQIQPYWDIAQQWVLADHMFQTQGSGSFTAHQDLIRGGTCITSTASCNTPSSQTASLVDTPDGMPWACTAPSQTVTYTINSSGDVKKNGPYPCSKDFPDYGSDGYITLRDRLDAAGVSWKYYTPCFTGYTGNGCSPSSGCPDCDGDLLNAFAVIWPVYDGSEWGTNVSMPQTNIFNDIKDGKLPAVSWVIPDDDDSDHPDDPVDDGPEWVASVVNAVGGSSYWKSSVVIVVWDDWGGFYDNAVPPFQDKYGGLGFRVPALILSPYALKGSSSQGGYVAHTQYEFGSILKFIENNWSLEPTGPTDARAKSIGTVLDFKQSPRSFSAIPSKLSEKYFLSRPNVPQHGDSE